MFLFRFRCFKWRSNLVQSRWILISPWYYLKVSLISELDKANLKSNSASLLDPNQLVQCKPDGTDITLVASKHSNWAPVRDTSISKSLTSDSDHYYFPNLIQSCAIVTTVTTYMNCYASLYIFGYRRERDFDLVIQSIYQRCEVFQCLSHEISKQVSIEDADQAFLSNPTRLPFSSTGR